MRKIIISIVIFIVFCGVFLVVLSFYKQNDTQACKVLMNMDSTLDEKWVMQNYESMKQKGIERTPDEICIVRILNETDDIFVVRDIALIEKPTERDEAIDEFVNDFTETYNINRGVVANAILKTVESLEMPLKKAEFSKVTSDLRLEIAVTVRMMLSCMEDNGYFLNPEEGNSVCRNSDHGTWTSISVYGGEWGGCEMEIDRVDGVAKGFTYCATLPDGNVVHCNESGCDFD